MIELFHTAFAPVNLVYTILLIVLVMYWCTAVLGLVDLDMFDLSPDVDAGADADFDLDAPAADGSVLQTVLSFFNFNEVPVMMYATLVVLTMWVVSVQLSYYLRDYIAGYELWFALGLAVPNLIFGLFMAKLITMPLRILRQDRIQETPLVGKTCTVVSLEVTENSGQCEIPSKGAPVTVHACTRDGEVLHKGDRAVIVERDRKNGVFTVTRYQQEA